MIDIHLHFKKPPKLTAPYMNRGLTGNNMQKYFNLWLTSNDLLSSLMYNFMKLLYYKQTTLSLGKKDIIHQDYIFKISISVL